MWKREGLSLGLSLATKDGCIVGSMLGMRAGSKEGSGVGSAVMRIEGIEDIPTLGEVEGRFDDVSGQSSDGIKLGS